MERALRLLILEDAAAEAELAVRALETAGLACSWQRVESETEFRAGLRDLRPDVVLSDFSLPQFDGMSALTIAAAEAPDTPFIFVSGTLGEERAIDALKHGAVDYVLKTNLARLVPAVRRALAEAALRRARHQAEERVAHLTRVRQMLSGINTAVVRVRDRTKVLEEACRIAHAVGNYVCAFVVLIDPRTRIARCAAWAGAGHDRQGELSFRVDDSGRSEAGESITGRALRTGEVAVCDDVSQVAGPWRFADTLDALAIRSIASIPLLIDDTPVGTFTVGSGESGLFGEDEVHMLQEVAANLAFALQYLYKEDTVRFLSYFDPLTGLAKRALFCERLARSLGRHAGVKHEVVVVAFDVERLGAINDSLGRHIGDRVVQFVADALRCNFGVSEWLAHLDGGSFAVRQADATVPGGRFGVVYAEHQAERHAFGRTDRRRRRRTLRVENNRRDTGGQYEHRFFHKSEKQLHGQLDLARRIRLPADYAELRSPVRQARIVELHTVQDVEQLAAKLKIETPVRSEAVVLEQAEIQVVHAVGAHVGKSAADISERVRRRLAEDAGVEPLVQA